MESSSHQNQERDNSENLSPFLEYKAAKVAKKCVHKPKRNVEKALAGENRGTNINPQATPEERAIKLAEKKERRAAKASCS